MTDAALREIANTQKGVKKDVQNIQDAIPQPSIMAVEERSAGSGQKSEQSSPTSARDWELQGFAYILERDVIAAINAFAAAEKQSPTYLNVAEIRRELVRDRQALSVKDSQEWKKLYRHLLNELSWGMPADVRQQMQTYAGQP